MLDLEQTADFMINLVFPQRQLARPLYLTSANGEVLARCSTEPMTDQFFGPPTSSMPMASRWSRCRG